MLQYPPIYYAQYEKRHRDLMQPILQKIGAVNVYEEDIKQYHGKLNFCENETEIFENWQLKQANQLSQFGRDQGMYIHIHDYFYQDLLTKFNWIAERYASNPARQADCAYHWIKYCYQKPGVECCHFGEKMVLKAIKRVLLLSSIYTDWKPDRAQIERWNDMLD